jgi:hypothetical protein
VCDAWLHCSQGAQGPAGKGGRACCTNLLGRSILSLLSCQLLAAGYSGLQGWGLLFDFLLAQTCAQVFFGCCAARGTRSAPSRGKSSPVTSFFSGASLSNCGSFTGRGVQCVTPGSEAQSAAGSVRLSCALCLHSTRVISWGGLCCRQQALRGGCRVRLCCTQLVCGGCSALELLAAWRY